jgi:uncharacterized membrane protein
MNDEPPGPPSYVQETHGAISRLDREHVERATALERAASRLTGAIGRPASLVVIAIGVPAWIAGNLLAARSGARPIDPPPFGLLQVITGVAALFVTVLILTTQRREDRLEDRREQLSLQLAVLSEQKSAKIIELLEEMRRDAPALLDREDAQAAAMAKASGPQTVLDAIEAYAEQAAKPPD